MKQAHLLVIDPQNDFCDLPASHCPPDPVRGGMRAPALSVAGAHADMLRLAGWIRRAGDRLAQVTVTLDSHHRVDIAHPTFWQTGAGAPVAPFTEITAAQVRAGAYRPRDGAAAPRTLAYLDALEARGRYTLMVWPVHCEIGSWGHNMHADLRAALSDWEERSLRIAEVVAKGMNPWTEHYSAALAEVPDETDPQTQLNRALIERLEPAELLLIAGEAGSHCVKATTEDVVEHLRGPLERVVLLTDCMSPVPGFEAEQQGFLEAMRARGVRTMASADALALLAGAGA